MLAGQDRFDESSMLDHDDEIPDDQVTDARVHEPELVGASR